MGLCADNAEIVHRTLGAGGQNEFKKNNVVLFWKARIMDESTLDMFGSGESLPPNAKPRANRVRRKPSHAEDQPSGQAGLFIEEVQIKGHTTKDGTYVAPYTAIRKKRHDVDGPDDSRQVDMFGGLGQSRADDQAAIKQGEPQPQQDTPLQAALKQGDIKAVQRALSDAASPDDLREALARAGFSIYHTTKSRAAILAAAMPQLQMALKRRTDGYGLRTSAQPQIIEAPQAAPAPQEQPREQPQVQDEPKPKPRQVSSGRRARPPKIQDIQTPVDEQQKQPSRKDVDFGDWFGVAPDVTKAQRKKLNVRAQEILKKADEDIGDNEKRELSMYSGQGGVGASLNEYYTRTDVVDSMWSILGRLGLSSGEVLEPSMGTGVFAARAPAGVRVVGVEMDGTSARISRLLHGGRHEINEGAFENFATTDPRQFDAVIGNPPFGLRGGLIEQDKSNIAEAERYFVDAAIDKTKPGGYVVMVVPSGIVSSSTGDWFRDRVLRKAEFLGAHRLPNTAFAHSHTGVVTDIIVLRKRAQDVANVLSAPAMLGRDDDLHKLGIWDEEFISGRYFEGRGARNVHGSPEPGWRAKANMGQDFTVKGSMMGVADAIKAAGIDSVETKPVTVQDIIDITPIRDRDYIARKAIKMPYEVAEVGDVKVVDGVTYVLTGTPPRWHRAEQESEHPSIAHARDIGARLAHLSPDSPHPYRIDAQRRLDNFIAQHGNPHDIKELKRAAKADPDLLRFVAAVGEDGAYSDLVTGVKYKRGDSLDAVAIRLVRDKDIFTADDVRKFTGLPKSQVLDRLYASQAYMMLPDGEGWTTNDRFFTGDLWARYDAIQNALNGEGLSLDVATRLRQQSEALLDKINPKVLEDISFSIASGWVPTKVIQRWLANRLQRAKDDNPSSVYYQSLPDPSFSFENGVYTITGGFAQETKLLDKWLNRTGLRKDDRPTIDTLDDDFREFAKKNEDIRSQLEAIYNRKYLGFEVGTHSNDPLDVPGLNPEIDVNPYHWGNLRWAMEQGRGIIAADVGLGKTIEGLSLSRLIKSNGMAKKPLIVVPKSLLGNWLAEIENFFPGSRVLAIGETNGKADTEAQRNTKWHDLAQSSSYDFILATSTAFDDVNLDPEARAKENDKDFWVQRGKQYESAGDKRQARIRAEWEQYVASRDVTQRTDKIYFNQLGVDALIMDEMHNYKNLYAAKNRYGAQPKFLGGSGLSDRAQDLALKTSWLLENHGNRGVYGLTATPTKNSPLEIFSMLSHVAPDMWASVGVRNAEEFLDRYATFEDGVYLGTNGEIKEGAITKGFKNMDELRELMERYIRRQTAGDVGLKIPTKNEVKHFSDLDVDQRAVYNALREEMENLGKENSGAGQIFSIMDRMGKATIDLETYNAASHAGHVSPKVRDAAENIVRLSQEGGQVVFCDSNQVHGKLADLLVSMGIPRAQIGIINGDVAKTSEARQKIAEAFNAGKLRVVIGNTGVMGEGLNLQKDTTDLHNLDLPWEPASLQQRIGRAVRQKNKHQSVRVHYYLTKGSFDGYRHQMVSSKKDWQDMLWHGGDKLENLEKPTDISREEMQIMMSADPEKAREAIAAHERAKKEAFEAEKRSDAKEAYIKFVDMSKNYDAMRDKGTVNAARMKHTIDVLRNKLNANRYFTAKDVLASGKIAAISASTGAYYSVGDGITVPGGDHGKFFYSDKETMWVVTGVSPSSGKISLRRYGDPDGSKYETTAEDLPRETAKFKHNVKEEDNILAKKSMGSILGRIERVMITHSTVLDRQPLIDWHKSLTKEVLASIDDMDSETWKPKRLKEFGDWFSAGLEDAIQKQVFNAAVVKDARKAVNDLAISLFQRSVGVTKKIANPKDLVGVDDRILSEHADDWQTILRHKFSNYESSWSEATHIPLIAPDGVIRAVAPYEAHKYLANGDRFALPTQEDKRKIIEAWKKAEGEKRRMGNDNKIVYSAEFGFGTRVNPYHDAITGFYGVQALNEASNELKSDILQKVQEAKSADDAFNRAIPVMVNKSQEGGMRLSAPEDVMEAVLNRAVDVAAPGDKDTLQRYIKEAGAMGYRGLAARTAVKLGGSQGDVLNALSGLGKYNSGGGRFGNSYVYTFPRDVIEAIAGYAYRHGIQGQKLPNGFQQHGLINMTLRDFIKQSDGEIYERYEQAQASAR